MTCRLYCCAGNGEHIPGKIHMYVSREMQHTVKHKTLAVENFGRYGGRSPTHQYFCFTLTQSTNLFSAKRAFGTNPPKLCVI